MGALSSSAPSSLNEVVVTDGLFMKVPTKISSGGGDDEAVAVEDEGNGGDKEESTNDSSTDESANEAMSRNSKEVMQIAFDVILFV